MYIISRKSINTFVEKIVCLNVFIILNILFYGIIT